MAALCHAILIEGGCAEERMAKAKDLLKEHFEGDPMAAVKIDAGTFEDLFIIEPVDSNEIKVKQIKDLIELFNQKPFASTGKACVIPRGESMNETAQNKLLKLLEEPQGGDIIIILTENAQMLLPTVRSRLMRVWLGYGKPECAAPAEDLRKLAASLVFGKGTLAEAYNVLAGYEGSREEAAALAVSFQLFLRDLAAEGASDEIKQEHADKMRKGVMLAEKAQNEIGRGDRVRYALRGMALSMRREC